MCPGPVLSELMFRMEHQSIFASPRWNVSQAEVIRRAVRLAADQSDAEGDNVRERLKAYRSSRRVTSEKADSFLQQVAEDRASWGRDR